MSIAQLLNNINKNKSITECLNFDINIIDNYIQNYKVKNDLYLNSQQKNGIKEVFLSNVSIIYGKAGTGKSSLLGGLLNTIEFLNNQFGEQQIQVLFLTPTANAKMKLYEDILKDYINYKDNIKTINSFCYMELIDCYKNQIR
jgi:DNA replication protein DnaC